MNKIIEGIVPKQKFNIQPSNIYKLTHEENDVSYVIVIFNKRYSSWNLGNLLTGALWFEKDPKTKVQLEEVIQKFSGKRIYSLEIQAVND